MLDTPSVAVQHSNTRSGDHGPRGRWRPDRDGRVL